MFVYIVLDLNRQIEGVCMTLEDCLKLVDHPQSTRIEPISRDTWNLFDCLGNKVVATVEKWDVD